MLKSLVPIPQQYGSSRARAQGEPVPTPARPAFCSAPAHLLPQQRFQPLTYTLGRVLL